MAESATYTIRFDVQGEGQVKSAETAAGRLDKAAGGVGRQLKSLALSAVAVTAAIGVFTKAMRTAQQVLEDSADKAIIQAQAMAQMEAVIKSTGGSAQRSVSQVAALASEIQMLTTVGDEAIIEMAALLGTFKSISGPEFDRTVQAVVDLSTRMGSLQSAAILLGKALDDPARRASELSRSGIVLTQTQKDLIQTFEELGDRAASQAIILGEVESQFGGAAAAAAQAAGGGIKQYHNAIGDLQELLGGPMVEAIDEVARSLTELAQNDDVVAFVTSLGSTIGATITVAAAFSAVMKESALDTHTFDQALISLVLTFETLVASVPGGSTVLLVFKGILGDIADELNRITVERTEPFAGFVRSAADASDELDTFDGKVRLTEAAFERLALASGGWTMTNGEAVAALKKVNTELDKARQRLDKLKQGNYSQLLSLGFDSGAQYQMLEQKMVEAQEGAIDSGLDYLVDTWGAGIEQTAAEALEEGVEKSAPAIGNEVADKLESGMGKVWAQASVDMSNAIAQAVLSGDVTSAINAFGAILGKVVSQAITNSLTDSQGGISALGAAAGPIAGVGIGIAAGLYASQQAAQDERRAKAAARQAEADRKLAEAFERLSDVIDESLGRTLLQAIETFERVEQATTDALFANVRYAETLEANSIIIRNLRNELLGIADEGFGDVLTAAIRFNEELPALAEGFADLARAAVGAPGGGPLNENPLGGGQLTEERFDQIMGRIGADVDYEEFQEALKDGIENALALIPEAIDLDALLGQLIEEFQGFGGRAQANSIRETAQSLREAAAAIEDLSDADLATRIDEITAAEERRLALLAAGPMSDILDIWERAGGDQQQIAQKRAEIEQIILTTKLAEARVTLEAAGMLTEFYANLIDELTEWVADIGNLIDDINVPSIGGISLGGGGRGRGRGGGRSQRRSDIEAWERAIRAWEDLDLDPFVRQARDLREERDRLVAEAGRLGQNPSRVLAAFNVAMGNLIEQANQSIVDLVGELRGGALSGLGEGAQFASAQSEYQRLLTAARFDPGLRDDLAQVAREMIDLRQSAFGPVGYRDFVNQTVGELERVVGRDALRPKTELSELETQTDLLERIHRALTGEEVTDVDRSNWQRQDETNRHLSDMARSLQSQNELFVTERTSGLVTDNFQNVERSAA